MYTTKTLLAAASLAVLTAAGLGTASAAPWDHHDFRVHERMEHRAFVNRWRVAETLRFHRYDGWAIPISSMAAMSCACMTASAARCWWRSILTPAPSSVPL